MEWIVVQTFATEIDAHIAKGKLESEGIKCMTQLNHPGDVFLGTVGMRTGPTDVLVPKNMLEIARKLLDEI